MLTRSKLNLTAIKVRDYSPFRNSSGSRCFKSNRTLKTKQPPHSGGADKNDTVNDDVLQETAGIMMDIKNGEQFIQEPVIQDPPVIQERVPGLSDKVRERYGLQSSTNVQKAPITELLVTKVAPDAAANHQGVLGNILLFDVESYKFPVSNTWIPHQIAWSIHKYDAQAKKLDCIEKRNYYVAELWIEPKYREEILSKYKHSNKNHLENLKTSDYPMKSSYGIMEQFLNDIRMHNVKTLASYNISSDFTSMKELVKALCANRPIDKAEFDVKYCNPFRFQHLNYVDLMHNVGTLYADYLIDEGFKCGKIFRNIATHNIKVSGRKLGGKSIYSAEFVLDKFFTAKQTHFADDDVKLEAQMLEKMLNDHGENGVELNVMYPEDLYLYKMFACKITEEYSSRIKSATVFKSNKIKNMQ